LKALKTPSSDTSPSFEGTVSETEQVTVKVYKGTKAEGTATVATARAGASSGKARGL
jgi:hypothetical protein